MGHRLQAERRLLMENVLSTKDLCKNYGKNRILKNVNMDIPKGAIFGLVCR